MGYDLAMWVGEQPESDAEGVMQLEERFDHYQICEHPLAPEIKDFIHNALTEYPIDDEEAMESSPWRDIPLQRFARGEMIYFTLFSDTTAETLQGIIALGKDAELVVVDPQKQRTY